MLRLLVPRLLWSLVIMLCLATVTFFLSHVVPADPAAFLAGQNAQAAQIQSIRHDLGLDKPLLVQYGIYLADLAHGNLGTSIRTKRPVVLDLRDALPASLELIFYAFTLYLILSFILGMLAATSRSKIFDLLVRVATTMSTATPVFWLGLVFQIIFYGHLRWLPLSGRLTIGTTPPPTITGFYTIDSLLEGNTLLFIDAVRHLILPSVVVALSLLAVGTRTVRAAVSQGMREQYVRTARAKGLGRITILIKHVLRPALNPIITITGVQLGYTVGFIILTEVVFDWPGIGLYAYDAFDAFDYMAIIGVTLVTGVAFILINLATDLIYPLFDPRVRI